jgi:hypothetical protein
MFGANACTIPLFVLLASSGCQPDKVRPPSAPDLDGGRTMVMPPPRPRTDGSAPGPDAGDADVMDGATVDASRPPGCVASDGSPEDPNRAEVTLGGVARAFPVTAAFAGFDAARCETPTLLVALTDGACAVARGQQLVFHIARDEIGATVAPGIVVLEAAPFDDAISVRYTALAPGGAVETRGSCAASFGSMTFEDVGELGGNRVAATFDITLTDCAVPQVLAPVRITGAFDLIVPSSFGDVCT